MCLLLLEMRIHFSEFKWIPYKKYTSYGKTNNSIRTARAFLSHIIIHSSVVSVDLFSFLVCECVFVCVHA